MQRSLLGLYEFLQLLDFLVGLLKLPEQTCVLLLDLVDLVLYATFLDNGFSKLHRGLECWWRQDSQLANQDPSSSMGSGWSSDWEATLQLAVESNRHR